MFPGGGDRRRSDSLLMIEESGLAITLREILRAKAGMLSGPVDLFSLRSSRAFSHNSVLIGVSLKGLEQS